MTTLENEWNNIRAYLHIQLIMHDNSFRVEETTDETAADLRIPKLMLQPLVENAIDHGLDESEQEDMCIRITARHDDRLLYLVVEDNGLGMDPEKASGLLNYQSRGYGLRNVNDRIVLLYGEEYHLRITSSPGKGTRVEIRIPRWKNIV